MTLGFLQQINKVPTYFVEKILLGMVVKKEIDLNTYSVFVYNYLNKFDLSPNNTKPLLPKIHTIREDLKNKWKPGNLIHFVINNRTKFRYQFAPLLKCVSVQKFVVHYDYNSKNELWDKPLVYVDGKQIRGKKLFLLANNDGFETVEAFFKYFNTNFTGKIIHWTNKKY